MTGRKGRRKSCKGGGAKGRKIIMHICLTYSIGGEEENKDCE